MAGEEVSIRDIVSRCVCRCSLHYRPPTAPMVVTHVVACRFIAASPSGELQFVLSDLRGLVNQDEFDLHAELPALVAECAPPSPPPPALAALTLGLRHNFAVHKSVTNNGLVVPLHIAGQLSDGYLFDPRSLQAFEYRFVALHVCVRACVS
jgi:hypothetical protein